MPRSKDAGCETVAPGAERQKLLWTMAEYFDSLGYTEIRARLLGYKPPGIIQGRIENHRPDLTARSPDAYGTRILLEVVTPFEVMGNNWRLRWELFVSKCESRAIELHFAVPRWTIAGRPTIEERVRARIFALDGTVNKVWTL